MSSRLFIRIYLLYYVMYTIDEQMIVLTTIYIKLSLGYVMLVLVVG